MPLNPPTLLRLRAKVLTPRGQNSLTVRFSLNSLNAADFSTPISQSMLASSAVASRQ